MLFTKEFLDKLSEKMGAHTMLNHYIDDEKMNFHDAVLRLANFHSMEPEYCNKGYSRPLSEEAKNLLEELYKMNEEI